MENSSEKIVTFFNHYAAMTFKKQIGENCALRAVPRAVSSSCGTCAIVRASIDEIRAVSNENLDTVYACENGIYTQLWKNS